MTINSPDLDFELVFDGTLAADEASVILGNTGFRIAHNIASLKSMDVEDNGSESKLLAAMALVDIMCNDLPAMHAAALRVSHKFMGTSVREV